MTTLPRLRLLLAGSLLAASAAASAQIVLAPPKPPGLPAPPVISLPAPGSPVVLGDRGRVVSAPAPGVRRGYRHGRHHRRHRR